MLGEGRPRLVVWVPGAFTPVCSGELDALTSLGRRAVSGGVDLLIASCDSAAALRAWLDAHGATGLIGASDFWPHGEVASMMGAFDSNRGTALRRSFAITSDGRSTLVAEAPPGEARDPEPHSAALDGLLRSSARP